MKLIMVLAAITFVYADKLDRLYLPANKGHSPTRSHTHHSHSAANAGFAGFGARMDRPNSSRDRNAAIIRQDFTNNIDSYSYSYETENGISAEEKGVATNGNRAQGGYSYTGDDGKVYAVWYTADENGFRPQGDHLPTPPPIPKEILKALEQNARDEAAGIFDDGSYRGHGQKQSHSSHSSHSKSSHSGYNRNAGNVGNSYLPPLYVV